MDAPLPERDDGVKDFPRFRVGLFAFADLLTEFDKHLQRRFGRDCWNHAAQAFRANAADNVFFKLLRDLSTSDRIEAVSTLEQVWRKGLHYQRPGGTAAGYKDRDCGTGPLVETARMVEALLARQASKAAAEEGEEAEAEPSRRK